MRSTSVASLVVVALATLVAGCGDGGGGTCLDGHPRGPGSFAVAEVATFTPAPEGVAVCPGGDVYVATTESGELWRLPGGAGTPELHATLTGRRVGGLACDEQGRLFVADFGGTETPACVRVDAAGHAGVVLPTDVGGTPLEHPNGVVVIPGAGVYLSDSGRGEVVRFVEQSADVYAATLVAAGADLAAGGVVPGANGLAYHAATSMLYVAVTAQSQVVAYDLLADGTLGAAPRARFGDTYGVSLPDGVAVDEDGTLFVANALGGEVVRVAESGEVVASVTSAASLVFRGGTLYVTSYVPGVGASGALSTLAVGRCAGAP